jgi:hypothetical protein
MHSNRVSVNLNESHTTDTPGDPGGVLFSGVQPNRGGGVRGASAAALLPLSEVIVANHEITVPLPAWLEGEVPIVVTAVLTRTAVYHLLGDEAIRHLAPLSFIGVDPKDLAYTEMRYASAMAASRANGKKRSRQPAWGKTW